MSGASAPFFAEVADGPDGGHAVWLKAADGVRIRLALWPQEGAQGTVVLLPGRTEYAEKYGRTAADMAARGYAMVAVDWRGQGLADRPLTDPMTGHVGDFAEYQADLDAVFAHLAGSSMPEPWYLLGHSMGGCIALRGVMRGLPVQAVAFSAPMWGILIAAWMRPLAVALSTASKYFAFDHRYAPGTGARTYVLDAPFLGNSLTTDAEMWGYMRDQAQARPELTLGGPSLGWLKAALHECHALAQMPAPRLPALTGLGTQERIVDVAPVHARMAGWPGGRLELFTGAEHEVLMERAPHRLRFRDLACDLFDAHR